MAAGIFAAGDPLPITLDLWAAAHAIASLLIAKPFLPARRLVDEPVTPRRMADWLRHRRPAR